MYIARWNKGSAIFYLEGAPENWGVGVGGIRYFFVDISKFVRSEDIIFQKLHKGISTAYKLPYGCNLKV